MPDMAVMPHMAASFVPPLSDQVLEYLSKHSFGADDVALLLLPLVQRSVLLRSTSVAMLQTAATELDLRIPQAIMSEVQKLDQELLDWNSSLPLGWGKDDHLYQLLTTSWFRTHRIFLADLAIRCLQLLAQLEERSRDEEIWQQVDQAQNAIDEICVRAPYTFGTDKPHLRKPHIQPRIVPEARLTYLYHSSFDYPLLVANMVWTLPPFRQRGIEEARDQCAKACGLNTPRKKYPKVLVYLTAEERERYIQHRVDRHQKWLKTTGQPCPFLSLPEHSCNSVSRAERRS